MNVNKININQSEPTYYIASDIYDVSYHNNGTTFDSLSTLLSSENLSTLIPTAIRCGGMTIRFIQSSDNRYVQYRLMSDEFNTDTTQWAIDDESVYIENPEFLSVKTDVEGKLLWWIEKDGSVNWSKGVPQPIQVKLQELEQIIKENVEGYESVVARLTANEANIIAINEALDNYKVEVSEALDKKVDGEYIENPEFLSIKTDSEDKIIEGIYINGKKYFPKQEMLEKYNDIEGRTEITTDSEGRILSYRNKDGVKYEDKLNPKNLIIEDKAANDIISALKKFGFYFDNVMDWSDSDFVEIPIPRTCAIVNIAVDNQAATKTDNIETYLEFWDKDGNYFKKPIILNAQGLSSMNWWKKNQGIDINDGSKIKFGNWVAQDSFHLKKFYIDVFRGQSNVGYWLTEQVYQTRDFGERKPYEYLFNSTTSSNGEGNFKEDFNTGALCHPDGFPFMLYFNGKVAGIYAWNLKKDRDNYYCKKDNPKQIILDGEIGRSTLFGGVVNWSAFEIRNPKKLITIDGQKYDGDNPTELSNSDSLSSEVKGYIERLSNAYTSIESNKTKETFEEYFLVKPFIDYFLIGQVIWHQDGFYKNWIWCTWDGQKWTPTSYDMDSIFGMFWQGTYVVPAGDYISIDGNVTPWTNTNSIVGYSSIVKQLVELYNDDIKNRYKELRDKGIFSTENIVSLLESWVKSIGYDNLKTDIEECCAYNGVPQTPSYRDGSKTYEQSPNNLGFYNSIYRVKKWLDEHFVYLDYIFYYKN